MRAARRESAGLLLIPRLAILLIVEGGALLRAEAAALAQALAGTATLAAPEALGAEAAVGFRAEGGALRSALEAGRVSAHAALRAACAPGSDAAACAGSAGNALLELRKTLLTLAELLHHLTTEHRVIAEELTSAWRGEASLSFALQARALKARTLKATTLKVGAAFRPEAARTLSLRIGALPTRRELIEARLASERGAALESRAALLRTARLRTILRSGLGAVLIGLEIVLSGAGRAGESGSARRAVGSLAWSAEGTLLLARLELAAHLITHLALRLALRLASHLAARTAVRAELSAGSREAGLLLLRRRRRLLIGAAAGLRRAGLPQGA